MEKMRVQTPVYYKGRRIHTNTQIYDYEKSGAYCLGLFADRFGIGIVVVKIFKYERVYRISESSFTEDFTKTEYYSDLFDKYEKEYNIEHFFGNSIASSIVCRKTTRDDKNKPYRGWLTVDIAGEHLVFLVQSRQKGIKCRNDELLKMWDTELRNVVLKDIRNKNETSPLTFALACVLEGAVPDNYVLWETNGYDLYDENDKRVYVPIKYNENEHEQYKKYLEDGYAARPEDIEKFKKTHNLRYCTGWTF